MSVISKIVKSILIVLTILIFFASIRSRRYFDTYFYTNNHLTVGISSFDSVLRIAYRDGSVGQGFHSQHGEREERGDSRNVPFAIRSGSDQTIYPSLYYLDLGWALILTTSVFGTGLFCFWRQAKGITRRVWTRASHS